LLLPWEDGNRATGAVYLKKSRLFLEFAGFMDLKLGHNGICG